MLVSVVQIKILQSSALESSRMRLREKSSPGEPEMIAKLLWIFAGIAASIPAQAHVKWFSKMADCGTSPITTLNIFSSPLFVGLSIAAAVAMTALVIADGRISRGDNLAVRSAARLDRAAADWMMPFLRLGIAAYFAGIVIYFSAAPIILTAELKTDAAWVPVLQLGIAATVLMRRGALLAALGIVILFAHAIQRYGLFHMLDYPFFLGLAAVLGIGQVWGHDKRQLAFAILRVTMGVSLLWCGVEKWLYPDWTYELLRADLKGLLMTGLSPKLIVMGAGFVEFCLAFILIFGRLASQVAAAVLLAVMMSAIPVVGMVDALGHLPILVVLLILAMTQNPIACHASAPGKRGNDVGAAISFMVSVPGFIGAYYLSHELAYDALDQANWINCLVAGLLLVLLAYRIVRTAPVIFGPLYVLTCRSPRIGVVTI
jgi:hypothetical protein